MQIKTSNQEKSPITTQGPRTATMPNLSAKQNSEYNIVNSPNPKILNIKKMSLLKDAGTSVEMTPVKKINTDLSNSSVTSIEHRQELIENLKNEDLDANGRPVHDFKPSISQEQIIVPSNRSQTNEPEQENQESMEQDESQASWRPVKEANHLNMPSSIHSKSTIQIHQPYRVDSKPQTKRSPPHTNFRGQQRLIDRSNQLRRIVKQDRGKYLFNRGLHHRNSSIPTQQLKQGDINSSTSLCTHLISDNRWPPVNLKDSSWIYNTGSPNIIDQTNQNYQQNVNDLYDRYLSSKKRQKLLMMSIRKSDDGQGGGPLYDLQVQAYEHPDLGESETYEQSKDINKGRLMNELGSIRLLRRNKPVAQNYDKLIELLDQKMKKRMQESQQFDEMSFLKSGRRSAESSPFQSPVSTMMHPILTRISENSNSSRGANVDTETPDPTKIPLNILPSQCLTRMIGGPLFTRHQSDVTLRRIEVQKSNQILLQHKYGKIHKD